jgi:hypothetical protein
MTAVHTEPGNFTAVSDYVPVVEFVFFGCTAVKAGVDFKTAFTGILPAAPADFTVPGVVTLAVTVFAAVSAVVTDVAPCTVVAVDTEVTTAAVRNSAPLVVTVSTECTAGATSVFAASAVIARRVAGITFAAVAAFIQVVKTAVVTRPDIVASRLNTAAVATFPLFNDEFAPVYITAGKHIAFVSAVGTNTVFNAVTAFAAELNFIIPDDVEAVEPAFSGTTVRAGPDVVMAVAVITPFPFHTAPKQVAVPGEVAVTVGSRTAIVALIANYAPVSTKTVKTRAASVAVRNTEFCITVSTVTAVRAQGNIFVTAIAAVAHIPVPAVFTVAPFIAFAEEKNTVTGIQNLDFNNRFTSAPYSGTYRKVSFAQVRYLAHVNRSRRVVGKTKLIIFPVSSHVHGHERSTVAAVVTFTAACVNRMEHNSHTMNQVV